MAARPKIEWDASHPSVISPEWHLQALHEALRRQALGQSGRPAPARSGARSERSAAGGLDIGGRGGPPDPPRLARYDEVAAGAITHALQFTVQRTRRAYVYPARHVASDLTDPNLAPMGLRLRLRADYPTAGFPPQARIVLEALKRYGMMVADNGSSWYITGAPDPRWSNDDLHTLDRVKGSDFEVINPAAIHP